MKKLIAIVLIAFATSANAFTVTVKPITDMDRQDQGLGTCAE